MIENKIVLISKERHYLMLNLRRKKEKKVFLSVRTAITEIFIQLIQELIDGLMIA